MNEQVKRVALVTGAGRGIGKSVALHLGRLQMQVACSARREAELDQVVREIREAGGTAEAFPIDLSRQGAPHKLVESVASGMGAPTILINNAGVVGPFGASWEVDVDDWSTALVVNLHAPFALAHDVIPHMIAARWGRIVNVSSGAARNPIERGGAYSVSKAGLDILTRQLGIELEGTGVAAISVHPGVVDTAMQTAIRTQSAEVVGDAVATRFGDYYESGRLQQPERPGRLIALLASEMGSEYNGKIVDIYDPAIQAILDSTV